MIGLLQFLAYVPLSLSMLYAAPGDLDPSFTLTVPSGNSGDILTLASLRDGSFLVGGTFSSLNGKPSRMFDRVQANGELYPNWPAATLVVDDPSAAVAVQGDGRIFRGGELRQTDGQPTLEFARLNEDGSPDQSFRGPLTGGVFAILPMPDGKTVLGGNFFNADKPPYLLRLGINGEVDRTFLPRVAGVNSAVNSMVQQSDGNIVIAGSFTSVGGVARRGLARISANGALDRSFAPTITTGGFTDPYVDAVALQTDGRILVAGSLVKSTVHGSYLARLHADGTEDTSFISGVTGQGFPARVSSMIVQTDGKILIAGTFTSAGGAPRAGIAKLNPDGSADPGFEGEATKDNVSVIVITMQSDGQFLLGGPSAFRVPGSSSSVVRVMNTPATQKLTASSPRGVRWLRGGSSPEARTVAFEFSASETGPWDSLGTGTRVEGGWEKSGLSLPRAGWLRGRAQVPSGWRNGSQGLLETISAFELIPEIAVRDGAAVDSPEVISGQPEAVDFGEVRLGVPVRHVLSVENPGNGDLRLLGVEAPAGFQFVNPPAFPRLWRLVPASLSNCRSMRRRLVLSPGW